MQTLHLSLLGSLSISWFLIFGTSQIAAAQKDSSTQLPRLITQVGHSGWINAVVFSPDGSYLLTGSDDRTARLWDAKHGRLLRTFIGHTARVTSVAFSSDSNRFLTGSFDGTARLWDVDSGTTIKTFDHGTRVISVSISFDDKRILTGGEDPPKHFGGEARLWDIETGKVLKSFKHGMMVASVAFSSDDRRILTGGADILPVTDGRTFGTVRLWNAENGCISKSFSYRGKKTWVDSATFSSDGNRVLIEDEIWDIKTQSRLYTLELQLPDVRSTTFTRNSRRIVSGGNALGAWDAANARHLFSIPLPEIGPNRIPMTAYAIAVSPDGQQILVGGDQTTALVYDIDKRSILFPLKGNVELDVVPVSNEVASLAFSSDSQQIAVGSFDRKARIWDLQKGRLVHILAGNGPRVASVVFSPLDDVVMTGSTDGIARLWNAKNGQKLDDCPIWHGLVDLFNMLEGGRASLIVRRNAPIAFSRDGCLALIGFPLSSTRVWDVKSRKVVREIEGGGAELIAFLANGTQALVSEALVSDKLRSMRLVNTLDGKTIRSLAGTESVSAIATAAGSDMFASGHVDGTVNLWSLKLGRLRPPLKGHTAKINSVAFSTDDKFVCTGSDDGTARVWDVKSGAEVRILEGHGDGLSSLAFSADGRFLATGAFDGVTRLWSAKDQSTRPLCSIVGLEDDSWFVTDSEGRFDTSNPEIVSGLHWGLPEDPSSTLGPEVFMREFYEPQLLSRVVSNEVFQNVRSLDSLNRVQPIVRSPVVKAYKADQPLSVTVEVSGDSQKLRRSDQKRTMRTVVTDVYDLRLFRDGQLVGRWPEPRDGGLGEFDPDPTKPEDMQKWQDLNRVKSDNPRVQAGPDGKLTVTFPVRLPSRPEPSPVEFTAYAFNEDRVKSETARFTYQAPAKPATTKPRAYLVCMGVSACETSAWKLTFAAKDAEVTATALGQALKETGRYDVVPVVLASQSATDGHPASTAATKGNLQAVLDLLAGKPVDPSVRKQLPNGSQLQQATPDDLVLVMFSGHGYTDPRGSLYLIPYDVGSDQTNVTDAKSRCISSGELSAWLRGIDAGEIMLVVDACHSAAAIEEPGFKPGPLGNRGLGQLAYDKGMRVLAAAQGNEVALEVGGKVRQGLLTYALVEDGLKQRRAAKGETITLGGLLAYAAERVPTLYEEVVAGKVKDATGQAAKDVTIRAIRKDAELVPELLNTPPLIKQPAQQPELFDYAKNRSDVPLDKK